MRKKTWWLVSAAVVCGIAIVMSVTDLLRAPGKSGGELQKSAGNSGNTGALVPKTSAAEVTGPTSAAQSTPPGKEGKPVSTNILAKFLADPSRATLSAEQVQAFLQRKGRSAENLLTAYQFTKDLALLREAAEKSPANPELQFQLTTHSDDPAEKQKALEELRKQAPENALGDYLAAIDLLKNGPSDQAVDYFKQGAGKSLFTDYGQDAALRREEAFRDAGYSPGEAKAAAMFGLERGLLAPLMELSKKVTQIRDERLQQGDGENANQLTQTGLAFASQVQGSATWLIDDLVGISIENRFADKLDADTRKARLDQIARRKEEIKALAKQADATEFTEAEAVAYFERVRTFGELEAMRWLREQRAAGK